MSKSYGEFREWYHGLNKPKWWPPVCIIKIVWQILYHLIFPTFAIIFYEAYQGETPLEVWLPFAINLALNLSWLVLIFKFRWLKLQPLLCILMNVSLYIAAEGVKEKHPIIYNL